MVEVLRNPTPTYNVYNVCNSRARSFTPSLVSSVIGLAQSRSPSQWHKGHSRHSRHSGATAQRRNGATDQLQGSGMFCVYVTTHLLRAFHSIERYGVCAIRFVQERIFLEFRDFIYVYTFICDIIRM